MNVFQQLPDVLLPWYKKSHRELPWRNTDNPYYIWISEIMLQQTRVEAVKGYYERFIKQIPDIKTLSNASDELLHKLWEGLGYYSRVRNLKKAAQVIVEKYAGVFPNQYEQIIELPGIGEYTAGAISSIAFDLPVPAVDGNVLRVISRITNDWTNVDLPAYRKSVRKELEVVYPPQSGEFTQALMELGATVCGPNKAPECLECPCCDICLAYKNDTASQLPVRSPKRKRKIEYKTVFIVSCCGHYALLKRPSGGLLAEMWQFPDCTDILSVDSAVSWLETMGFQPKEIYRQVDKKHIFTHVEWVMRGIYIEVENMVDGYVWFSMDEVAAKAALPTAYKQFLDIV